MSVSHINGQEPGFRIVVFQITADVGSLFQHYIKIKD